MSAPRPEELTGILAPQPERELLGELIALLEAERDPIPQDLLALAKSEWLDAK